MPISLTQSTTGSITGTAGPLTLTLTSVASGSLLTVLFAYGQSSNTTAVATPTDSGGTWVAASAPAGQIDAGVNITGSKIYYEQNAAGGTHTATIAFTGGNAFCIATLAEWAGALTSGALDVATSANATTAQTNTSGTTAATAQASELSVVALCVDSGAGVADAVITNPPAGYTTLQYAGNTTTNEGTQHSYKVLAATGTQSVTWSWTDGTTLLSQGAIATFKASGVAATVLPVMMFDNP